MINEWNISDEEVKIIEQSINELRMNYITSKESEDKNPEETDEETVNNESKDK